MISRTIYIQLWNGDKYTLDALYIAKARAEYYASRDCEEDSTLVYDDVYNKEIEIAMNDGMEILDWLNNNTSWNDIKSSVVKEESSKIIDFEEAFSRAEINIRQDGY